MKAGRVAIVGILFIAMLVVSGANADKPEGQGRAGKPPLTNKECIVFTGDLEGKQVVEGCCLNRGPYPEYRMTLSDGILEGIDGGVYDGHLFVNQYRPGRIHQYMVEFWTDQAPVFHFVVTGGFVREDTKNKLVVDFFPGNFVCDDYYRPETYRQCLGSNTLTFTLVRTSESSCGG